jgi:hypothetical protein
VHLKLPALSILATTPHFWLTNLCHPLPLLAYQSLPPLPISCLQILSSTFYLFLLTNLSRTFLSLSAYQSFLVLSISFCLPSLLVLSFLLSENYIRVSFLSDPVSSVSFILNQKSKLHHSSQPDIPSGLLNLSHPSIFPSPSLLLCTWK